jgi:hypothetical protein
MKAKVESLQTSERQADQERQAFRGVFDQIHEASKIVPQLLPARRVIPRSLRAAGTAAIEGVNREAPARETLAERFVGERPRVIVETMKKGDRPAKSPEGGTPPARQSKAVAREERSVQRRALRAKIVL